MRRALLICALALGAVAAPAAHAGYGDTVTATPGVVAYWPLDDHSSPIASAVGSFPGTASGSYRMSLPAGIDTGGTAIALWDRGSIKVGANPELDFAADRTVEAWIAPTSTSNQRYVVSRGTSSSGYHLYLQSGAVPSFRVGRTILKGPALRAGGWHHVVATLTGTTMAMYVNGQPVATGTHTSGTLTTGQNFWIGRYSNSTSTYYRYQGGLDEIAVYNRGLTAGEVAAHFAAGADTTPPRTIFSSAPGPVSQQPEGSFAFTGSKGGVTFGCTLDGEGPEPCAGSFDYDLLRDGDHTLAVTATDRWGTTHTTSYTWHVALPGNETAPPVTVFAATPAPLTNSTVASFAFTGSKTKLAFSCRLDGAAWAACDASASFGNLREGTHTLEVRATDRWGVVEATPPAFRWTIDLTAPETFVLAAKARRGDAGSAVLGSEPGTTFECRSAEGGWAACPAAFALPAMPAAAQLLVRAIDAAGNADPSPSTIVIEPAPKDEPIAFSGASASFTVGGVRTVSDLRCSLDGAAPTTCAWPLVFSNLAYGDHTLQITDPNMPGVVFPTIAWADPLPTPRIVGSQFPAVLQLGSRRKQASLARARLPRILFQSNAAGAARVELRRGKRTVRRWRAPVVQGSNLVRLPRGAWRRLRPGRYRLAVVVSNASGRSKPLTLRFDAVRSSRR